MDDFKRRKTLCVTVAPSFLHGAHKLSFADCGGLFPARGAKGAGLPRRAISSAVGGEVHVADIAAATADGLSVAKRQAAGEDGSNDAKGYGSSS